MENAFVCVCVRERMKKKEKNGGGGELQESKRGEREIKKS